MARLSKPYIIQKRNDSQTFILTLTIASGLPRHICQSWKRKSFIHFPDALAMYRRPASKTFADRGAMALVEYLKQETDPQKTELITDDPLVGDWLRKFTTYEGNPRSARLTGKNRPYSPKTIKGYQLMFNRYVKNDPINGRRMQNLEQTDMLEFMSRLGEIRIGLSRKDAKKNGYKLAGTVSFERILKFVRMAFREYGKTHPRWLNPFQSIDAPKAIDGSPRDILDDVEVIHLFNSDAFADCMEKAVCSAMYWAGLRRSEIFALKPEHLDWKTPKIRIKNAWKDFDSKDREMGDPKWHKEREVPFPAQLQDAIRELWAEQGQHEYVFAWKKGVVKRSCLRMTECDIPGPSWIKGRMKKWLSRSGIDLSSRSIVPHSARHSLATMLEQENVSLRYIQDLLGHSDYKTTKGYLHSVEGTLTKIGNRINNHTAETETVTGIINIS
jgi:integrase/recombinase XerD